MERNLLGLFVYQLLVFGHVLCCIDDGQRDWANLKEYRLQCPMGGVMVHLNVNAGLGKCPAHKSSECQGLTPYLIEESHSCYWNEVCDIRVPNWRRIDIIVKSNNSICFGQNPNYLDISNVLCFNPSKPDQLITSSNQFRNPPDCTTTAREQGIIRSHSYYPWDYEGTHVFKKGSYCFELYLSTKPSKRLVITVNDFDMWESDTVSIKSIRNDSETKISALDVGKSLTFDKPEQGVSIKLEVGVTSNGGRGFVICFAHINILETNPNACAAIVSNATITPVFKTDPVSDSPVKSPDRPDKSPKSPDNSREVISSGNRDKSPAKPTTGPTETCKDCKTRCKKLLKKERRTCNKGCRPLCRKKKGPKKQRNKKGKKDRKKKTKRRAN